MSNTKRGSCDKIKIRGERNEWNRKKKENR